MNFTLEMGSNPTVSNIIMTNLKILKALKVLNCSLDYAASKWTLKIYSKSL